MKNPSIQKLVVNYGSYGWRMFPRKGCKISLDKQNRTCYTIIRYTEYRISFGGVKLSLNKLAKAISYKEKVYEELKSAIISQRLALGELLNERDLADKLGISRTPVREALQRLENEGLVITEPWRGTRVNEIKEKDIEEVFQLRLALEPVAVELALQRMTAEDLTSIEQLRKQQISFNKHTDADAFIKTDMDFHMLIARLSGNKRLIQIVGNLIDIMRRLGISAIQTQERCAETLEEHAQLIKALKNKDIPNARQAMIYHILRTRETIYRRLREKKTQEQE